MRFLAALLFVAAALLGQADETFTLRQVEAPNGGQPRLLVAADTRALSCLDAVQRLARTCNWNLAVESPPLEADLRFATVDLNLADQDARLVAQLICVAGDADCVFDESGTGPGGRVTLHVVRPPSAETESGRQRLRSLSGQWYRSFLRDDLQYEPLVQREAVQVRMHLGQLLVESGDLEAAIPFFQEVFEKRPHDHVGQALLAIGACWLDLAAGETDRTKQKDAYGKAEAAARSVFERMPTAPEVTPATILVGKALLGQARAETQREAMRRIAERCQEELRARAIRLLDSVEMLDVWLLAAQAQFLLERPDRVHETVLTMRESPYFVDMRDEQFRDYHFLLGYGALGTGKPELAMKALEWFLLHADADPRRGLSLVLLAEAYLAQQRFVQARAASIEARTRFLATMTSDWRERALRVWARSALALGEKESAFVELEQMVMRGEEPELALFLVDEMLLDRQWQRAIAIASTMVGEDSSIGDRARFKTVQALYQQAAASEHFDDFPAQATLLAPRIKDAELMQKAAEMIGDAYARLGKLEHAADAYRGILR